MTEWITDFRPKDFIKKSGAMLLGDRAERYNTVSGIIGSWNARVDGPLIVLDPTGNLYEKYGGRGILIDFESANSLFPDVYTPIFKHRKYGLTPRQAAKLIVDVIVKEGQDRGSNDMFWSQSGRQTLIEYVEYGLLFAYLDRCSGRDSGNALLDASASHNYLSALMNDLVARGGDAAEKWNPQPEEKPKPWSNRQKDNLTESLTEQELEFKDVLSVFYGDKAIPFADTLVSYTKGSHQTNTTNCILKTAQGMGRRLLEFNQKLLDDFNFYNGLERLDICELMAGTWANGIIFLINGTDREVSSLSSLLTILGCAVAADSITKQITCLVPDITLTDVFEGICKQKDIFPVSLRFVIGCSDFIRAARRTDLSLAAYMDKLADLTNQNIIWHKSGDELLKAFFKERTAGQNVMYGVGDLGGNRMVAVEHGGDLKYAYVPDACKCDVVPAIREERKYEDADTPQLWFFMSRKLVRLELPKPDEENDNKKGADSFDIDSVTEVIWGNGGDEE